MRAGNPVNKSFNAFSPNHIFVPNHSEYGYPDIALKGSSVVLFQEGIIGEEIIINDDDENIFNLYDIYYHNISQIAPPILKEPEELSKFEKLLNHHLTIYAYTLFLTGLC